MLNQILDRWSQTSRRRWQRIAIAALAGAVVAVAGVFKYDTRFAMRYWPVMALLGGLVGFLGGCLLAIQEDRHRAGRPMPWLWRATRRTVWIIAVGLSIVLIPLLIYTMWQVLNDPLQ